MSIAQSILANPSKYSLAQLTQGVENGVIPAYIGIPIIQEKMQQEARMRAMGQSQGQGQPAQPPIADQIMAQAQQGSQGVESLQSNLPQSYAGGGIVAFEEGGQVERFQVGGTPAGRFFSAQQAQGAEYEEAQRLRNEIISKYGPSAGLFGLFKTQTDAERQAAQNLLGKVDTMTLPQLREVAAKGAPTPTTPASSGSVSEAQATAKAGPQAQVPPPGITPLPDAGRNPFAAGPGAGPAQTPFTMPAAPTGKSAEDFARTQFAGLGERSDARLAQLTAAQDANKMEGKAFDGLKKTLEEEAAQAGVEKSDAKSMAIFKAGLAMMSGTSRNALENIGKGAMVGAEDYQKAAADLKKADKERQKQFAAIEEARRAEDRDDIKTRNARLETAYKAGQRMDELGSAAISAGFGVDKSEGMDVWKTQFSAAATQRAAETSAAATRYSADRSADSRLQAAELKASLAGLGGAGKGALTQDQLIKNRQALADSPQIAAYKEQLIKQYGKNVVNQPRFQEDVNKRIDQLLMQMLAPPGATGAPDALRSFMAQNPSLAQYFR
jgi:hypothetical protein